MRIGHKVDKKKWGQKLNVNTNDDADDCMTQHIDDCVALHNANTHKYFHRARMTLSSMAFFAIGLAVFLSHCFLFPIDGCSISPTRSFGPSHHLLTPSRRTATNISFGTHTCISFS